jgi:AcrR family transcriptional regulator
MDDVVRETGISKKTLYQHFKDKSDLVLSVIDCDSKKKMLEHKEALEGTSNAIEKMLAFFNFQINMVKEYNPSMIYDLRKYYPKMHLEFIKKKREIIYENVLKNIIQGKAEGLYRENLNEEVIAMLNLIRVEAIANSEYFKSEQLLTKAFLEEMFTYHMYGIVSDKGKIILEQNIDKLK